MEKKPFDPDLYGEDDNAKWLVIDWLHENEFYAWVNPDQYGIDVIAFKEYITYGFEVEVKHNWKGYLFPFNTVHFSARKKKFLGENTFFTMLNDDRSHLLLADGDVLAGCDVVSKKTKYTELEEFIEIPRALCRIYPLSIK